MKKTIVIVLLLTIAFPFTIGAIDRITISSPYVDPAAAENSRFIDTLLREAVVRANGFYGDSFSVRYNGVHGAALEGEKHRGQDTAPKDGSAPHEADDVLNTAYTVKLSAFFNGPQSTMTLTMAPASRPEGSKAGEDGQPAELSSTILGPITEERSDHISDLIFLLWSGFNGYFEEEMTAPPRYVEELPADIIGESIAPSGVMQLYPYSAAVKADGNILVGMISRCVELDRRMRIVREHGSSFVKENNYNFAYGVAVTPGGTIFLKPSAGREVYKLLDSAPRPQRVRVGLDVTGPVVALPDGSVVVIDSAKKKALRIDGRKRQELDLFTYEHDYISTAAAGPEGNLWVFDSVEGRIRIYAPDGTMVDSIVPIVDTDVSLNPLAMAVYPDGRFLLYSYNGLSCFGRDGIPIWKMNELDVNGGEPLPQMAGIAIDGNSGLIYLADVTGRRIVSLFDTAYAEEYGLRDPETERILEFNKSLSENPGSVDIIMKRALFYEEIGSYELARTNWELILDYDPFHEEALAHLDSIELDVLKTNAEKLHAETVRLLGSLGPESARDLYSQTVRLYERIMRLDPDDAATQVKVQELKEKFTERSAEPAKQRETFTVVEVSLNNIFPSLLHYYRSNAAGTVTVRNDLDRTVTGITARCSIRKYMDFPVETAGPDALAPGEEAEIPLNILLNEEVLKLQEDLPIQTQIEIGGKAEGTEVVSVVNKTVSLHRRTALTWDQSGRLAGFIMPNEEIVSRFSHRVLAVAEGPPGLSTASTAAAANAFTPGTSVPASTDPASPDASVPASTDPASPGTSVPASMDPAGLPEKMARAARICDAVGTYGINYIEDPESPISRILERKGAIDTVRFPRTTLFIQSGDCDDTTALVGSLLESVGVRTAIMTSPGHVFLAFDSEEPSENSWLFASDEFETLVYEKTVWIPVETTILSEGFVRAWKKASELVRRHKQEGELEFLPVHTLRDVYPPLPLSSETSVAVPIPEPESVAPLYASSIKGLRASLYNRALQSLLERVETLSGIKKVKIGNRIGVLHARFGSVEEAKKSFIANIEEAPQFLPSYVNAANIMLQENRPLEAREILEKGIDLQPDSPLLNLLMARTYVLTEDAAEASRYFRVVEAEAPETASRFEHFFGAGTVGRTGTGQAETAERAGTEGPDFPFIWPSE